MADTETDAEPTSRHAPERWKRMVRARHVWDQVILQARDSWQWARQQPPRELITGVLALLAAVGLLWLVGWALSALVGWLFSPDAAQPPAAPGREEPPPAWVVQIQHAGLWERIYAQVAGYAQGASGVADTPGWLLLAIWAGIGVVVLLGGWFSQSWRALAGTVAWWGWVAATCWTIWTTTPGGSPVPAVLIAGLGVVISIVPWSTPLVALLVVLGSVPM